MRERGQNAKFLGGDFSTGELGKFQPALTNRRNLFPPSSCRRPSPHFITELSQHGRAVLFDRPIVISGNVFFPDRKSRIASAIWVSVTLDKSFAAASNVRVNSRFQPGRFLPRGKSWYTAAVGSCSLSSFARSRIGIRTSIGSRPFAGRDRSERYRALETCSSLRLDNARAKSVSTSVEVPRESFRYRAIFASRRSRLSNQ